VGREGEREREREKRTGEKTSGHQTGALRQAVVAEACEGTGTTYIHKVRQSIEWRVGNCPKLQERSTIERRYRAVSYADILAQGAEHRSLPRYECFTQRVPMVYYNETSSTVYTR
jgi:hypothetical protein